MKIIALITLIVLIGCAPKSDKAPSTKSEQYKKDLAICKQDADKEMARTAGSGVTTLNNTNAELREEELTNLCLMAKDVY
jgi:hypothetical protein